MKTAAILTPLGNQIFGDLAKALTMSFMELGWHAMWIGDRDQVREYARSIDVGIVLTPFDYPNIHRLLPNAVKVYYQLEALPWPTKIHLNRRKYWKWDERLELMQLYDVIFEHDRGNIDNQYKYYPLKRPALYAPIGYSPVFELPKKVQQRNVALFIGNNVDHPQFTHRHRTLKFLSAKLRRRFAICQSRYGDKARQTAKNCSILVNVHQNNIPSFESMRIVALGMSNHCFVITEPCEDLGPFEHLEHLVVVKHQDMAAEISNYLHCDWERERISNNAYNLVKTRYTMTENLREVVKQL